MTQKELEQYIRSILPSAEIGTDNEGQIIIYTGLRPYVYGQLEEIDKDQTYS